MARYSYSPTETRLLKMLPAGPNKRVDSNTLAKSLYAGREMPFNGKIYVNTSMRKLMEKVKANRESFKIGRSETRPYQFWIIAK